MADLENTENVDNAENVDNVEGAEGGERQDAEELKETIKKLADEQERLRKMLEAQGGSGDLDEAPDFEAYALGK